MKNYREKAERCFNHLVNVIGEYWYSQYLSKFGLAFIEIFAFIYELIVFCILKDANAF